MKAPKICIIGMDEYFKYLSEYLEKEGMQVSHHPEWNEKHITDCDLLIGPADFYNSNKLLPEIDSACATYHVPILNYHSSREYDIANAEFCAEGLVAYIIRNTPFALTGSGGLILGFDRIGSALSKRLHVLGCRVDVYDLFPEVPDNPTSYDFVVNTHPESTLPDSFCNTLRDDCLIFNLSQIPADWVNISPKSKGYMIGSLAINYLN